MQRLVIFLFLVLINSFTWINYFQDINNKNLEITFLNVGQGDSILLRTPDGSIGLIDTGKDNSVFEELSKHLDPLQDKFTFVIGTHADSDHIGNITKIIETYDVENLFLNKAIKDSETYADILEIVKEKHIKNYSLYSENDFKINHINFDVIWPLEDLESNKSVTNNNSIGLLITYKDFELLTMGDLDSENEIQAINQIKKQYSQIDALKVSHHGSKTSTSKEMLELIDYRLAIISVGENNPYGHPNKEVLNNLENLNIDTYTTSEFDSIKINTNGEIIDLNTKNNKNIKKYVNI